MTKRILLISADDRRSARLQVALLRYGLMVEVAGTLRRGLAVAQHRPPAAIVVDEALADVDCAQLARVLRADEATARVPVVTVSSGGAALLAAQVGGEPVPAGLLQPEAQVADALRCRGVL
jgi:DNA-binding response OmpR family regulator